MQICRFSGLSTSGNSPVEERELTAFSTAQFAPSNTHCKFIEKNTTINSTKKPYILDKTSLEQVLQKINDLCTYDLYSPEHNVLDYLHIHYEGKWEGFGPWNLRVFGPCEMALSL